MVKSDEKPLPRKADESIGVLSREPESTEGINVWIDRRFNLGTRKLPQALL